MCNVYLSHLCTPYTTFRALETRLAPSKLKAFGDLFYLVGELWSILRRGPAQHQFTPNLGCHVYKPAKNVKDDFHKSGRP